MNDNKDNKESKIEFSIQDIQDVNKATFDAFIESGNYALSYRKACEQFGRDMINALTANKLLIDRSATRGKRRFLISDIISAMAVWDKM